MPVWGTTTEPDPLRGRIFAPFDEATVEALNNWQEHGGMHPFTCPDHSDTSLVATEHGWTCPHTEGFAPVDVRCDYTQNWAHGFMARPVQDNQAILRFFDRQHARRVAAAHRRDQAQGKEPWKAGDIVRFTPRDPHPDDTNEPSFFRIDENGDGHLLKGPWIPGDMQTLGIERDWTVVDFTVEFACEVMHDAYEKAASGAGWETNPVSRKPWAEVPEANKETMRAAVTELLRWLGKED